MCLLALYYRILPEVPVVLAANRDEYFDRPTVPPHVQPGEPQVVCGVDQRAGGTWLGVNEHGLVVTVTNRPKVDLPTQPRSRGALCRDLLALPSADEAAARALAELGSGRYAGANYLCVDRQSGWIVYGGDDVRRVVLEPGLHTLAAGEVNDESDARQQLARRLLPDPARMSPDAILNQMVRVFSRSPESDAPGSMVLRAADRGTVSSTLLAIALRREACEYRYAAGPPDRHPYDDYSDLLRGILV
jgi:uncharacterized protein with NRDE domain